MRNSLIGLITTGLLLSMCSCYDPHAQQSAIVREVEAAGSGNLNSVTLTGVVDFFSTHQVLAKKISMECAPLEKMADAHWVETSEGTVCQAAKMMAPASAWTADKRGY